MSQKTRRTIFALGLAAVLLPPFAWADRDEHDYDRARRAVEQGEALPLARGGRLDETRPGTGLGLAIVGDLAEAHEGSCALRRSSLGGLLAEVRLPGRGWIWRQEQGPSA